MYIPTDIKPGNIGFDKEGCLKLFDFGLAKELPADSDYYHGESKHHKRVTTCTSFGSFAPHFVNLGNTGTPRQMAPEVIRREPYNCQVDVFATSIVAWELLMLQKPYGADMSGEFVKECVAIYCDRPTPIPRKWPHPLRRLIQDGWAQRASSRPSSMAMRVKLETILADVKKQWRKRQEQSQ